MAIVIDGPNASGKGTLCRNLSEWLGFPVMDTGLLYRAAGLAALKQGVDPDDESASQKVVDNLEFEVQPPDVLFMNGYRLKVSELRRHDVGEAASKISVHGPVRDRLRQIQQDFAARGSVILDGRDVGTRIYPQAKYKIYLTASQEIRAKRRAAEIEAKGGKADYQQILEDVVRRDERDQNRSHDPLRPAEGAKVIDTSSLSAADVFRNVRTYLASVASK